MIWLILPRAPSHEEVMRAVPTTLRASRVEREGEEMTCKASGRGRGAIEMPPHVASITCSRAAAICADSLPALIATSPVRPAQSLHPRRACDGHTIHPQALKGARRTARGHIRSPQASRPTQSYRRFCLLRRLVHLPKSFRPPALVIVIIIVQEERKGEGWGRRSIKA